MEQYTIKSVAFGGFDKEDVARYIEQISQETEKLREERDALREQAGKQQRGKKQGEKTFSHTRTLLCARLRSDLACRRFISDIRIRIVMNISVNSA